MPKYRIKSPDGQTYEVNAPEGASEQEIIDFAQTQFDPAPIVTGKRRPVVIQL